MKQTLIVGDELDQTTDVPDYPPSAGWTMYYRLVPQTAGTTQTPILLAGVPTADDQHRHVAAPATTATWIAGAYSGFAWVEDSGGRKITIDPETGVPGDSALIVTLQPDPRTVTTFDGRSPARVRLDALDAAYASFGDQAFAQVKSYTIGNRSIEYRDTFANQTDFLAYRADLAARVWREEDAARVAAGQPSQRHILIGFGRV